MIEGYNCLIIQLFKKKTKHKNNKKRPEAAAMPSSLCLSSLFVQTQLLLIFL